MQILNLRVTVLLFGAETKIKRVDSKFQIKKRDERVKKQIQFLLVLKILSQN